MMRAVRFGFGLGLAAGALLSLPALADPAVVLTPPPGVRAAPATPAVATPAPARLHGVVKSFDGQYLTMKLDAGRSVVIGVQPTTRVVHGQMLTAADLHPGDFVGMTAIKGADGKLRAQGVRIFPAGARSGEGLYPMPSNPARTIVNGAIGAITPFAGGVTLKLSFQGAGAAGDPACAGHAVATGCTGSADLIVARGVPIVSTSQGDTTLLLPGAIVSATVTPDAASLLTATSVTVERDGKPVAPPLLPSVP